MARNDDLLRHIAENPGAEIEAPVDSAPALGLWELRQQGLICQVGVGWEATPEGLDHLTPEPQEPEALTLDLARFACFCPHCEGWVHVFLGVGDHSALACRGCHRAVAHTRFFK